MRNQQISLKDQVDKLSTAIEDVANHNNSFSWAAQVTDLLAEHIIAADKSYAGASSNDFSREDCLKASVQDIFHCHRGTLEQAGIGLVVEDNDSLSLVLIDIDRITNFFAKIPPGTEYAQTMKEVAKVIPPAVRSLVDIDEVEYLANALGDLKYLTDLLARRGAGESIEKSYTLLEAATRGYLKEQILVDKSGILENMSFGPADWHKDSTAPKLYEHWNKALATLKQIKKSPEAESLTDRVRIILESGLDAFEKDIKSWEKTRFPYHSGKLSDYKGVARLVRSDFVELMASI